MTEISYSNEYTIREAKREDAFPETFSHWNRIKGRIRSIEQCDPLYQTAIGVLIGIAITAIFGLISLPEGNPTWYGKPLFFIYLAVAIGCGLAAIPFIYFDRKQRGTNSITKEDIIEEMEQIEERFKKDEGLLWEFDSQILAGIQNSIVSAATDLAGGTKGALPKTDETLTR